MKTNSVLAKAAWDLKLFFTRLTYLVLALSKCHLRMSLCVDMSRNPFEFADGCLGVCGVSTESIHNSIIPLAISLSRTLKTIRNVEKLS